MDAPTSFEQRPLIEEVIPGAVTHVSPLEAFRSGLRLALRYWPALMLMLLGALLSAAALAVFPALNLMELARLPVIAQMADGIDTWQIVDLVAMLVRVQRGGNTVPQALQGGMIFFVLGVLLLPVVGGLISAFLYGGVILTYAEAPAPFRFGRFFWGCWHWFGGFLLLAAVQALLFLLVVVPASLISLGLLFGLGTAGISIWGGLVLLVLLVWLMLFELARVKTVTAGTRNPFKGLGLAFGLLFQRPLVVLGFYAAAVLLWAVIQAVFRLGLLPVLPLDVLPVAFTVQQVFILSRLFARAVRLAGLVSL